MCTLQTRKTDDSDAPRRQSDRAAKPTAQRWRAKMNEGRQLPVSVRRGAQGDPRRPTATPRCATITATRAGAGSAHIPPSAPPDLLASVARRRLKIAARLSGADGR
uniref:Uncharacterized protein n=1 Tax=Plectus sambesii TaxID=2011161 RepID=A0A914UVK9_9BILA